MISNLQANMGHGPGRWAIVTGGSSGMGMEYVRLLAGLGYDVVIVALDGCEAVAARMREEFPERRFIALDMDLARREAAHELQAALPEGLQVEVLVNNAGIIHIRHFRDMSPEDLDRIVLLHNYTPTQLCRIFLPEMAARGKGYVLNISSITAWMQFPFISTYAGTKAYLRQFTGSLRTEYRGTGVQVAAIYFGAVDTPLYNLSPRWRTWLRRLGIMISPQRAARRAMRMLFAGRSGAVPGLVNKLAIVLCPLLPQPLVAAIDRAVTRKLDAK